MLGYTTSDATLHPDVAVPGILSAAVSWRPHARSRHHLGFWRSCLLHQRMQVLGDRLCRLHRILPPCDKPQAPATRRKTCLAAVRRVRLSNEVSRTAL